MRRDELIKNIINKIDFKELELDNHSQDLIDYLYNIAENLEDEIYSMNINDEYFNIFIKAINDYNQNCCISEYIDLTNLNKKAIDYKQENRENRKNQSSD